MIILDNRDGSTNLQVMHVKKSADQNINLSIDNMVYIPDTNENRVRNEGICLCCMGANWKNVYLCAIAFIHR